MDKKSLLIQSLTCEGDTGMRENLEADPLIRKIAAEINRRTETQKQTGRALLGSSLRITESIAPDIFAVGRQVVAFSETEGDPHFFIYPEPQFNAACFAPENGKLYIIVSSGLIESFSNKELVFILGHELGHLAARHHSFPTGEMVATRKHELGPDRILRMFAWQRYAEITADRIGAYLAGSFDITGKVFFKLASGVGGDRLSVNLEDFLSQLDLLEEEIFQREGDYYAGTRTEWYATHPFSPIRLRALELFYNSDLYTRLQLESSNIIIDRALEDEIARMMELMTPGYLSGKSEEDEIMRRLLFAAGIILTSFTGKGSDEESRMLQAMLEKVSLPVEPDLGRLQKILPDLKKEICEKVSVSKRTRLMNDLILIAKADGKLSDKEREFLINMTIGLALDSGSFNI